MFNLSLQNMNDIEKKESKTAMPMLGKTVKFAVGTKESLYKSNKKLTEVEVYIDGESGTLYIVPKEDRELEEDNSFLRNIGKPFENLI